MTAIQVPDHIVCPKCRARLGLRDQSLVCPADGLVGAVEQGVFDFVGGDDYAASFGEQWTRFHDTQVDSKNGTTISRDQFVRVTNWSRRDLEGQLVLDAGCGSGRYTEIAVSMGARVTAIDLSVAARIAHKNVPQATAVRGNLLAPPFQPGTFDKVFSIGVIQHTPNPLEVAENLMRLVRPGGQLAIWMYEKRWYTPFIPKMVLRRATRRLPQRAFLPLARMMVGAFTPVARLAASLPGRRLKSLARGVLPIASYWHLLPLGPEQQRQWSILDTNDWLTPAYDSPQTFADVSAALRAGGAAEVVQRPVPGLTLTATKA